MRRAFRAPSWRAWEWLSAPLFSAPLRDAWIRTSGAAWVGHAHVRTHGCPAPGTLWGHLWWKLGIGDRGVRVLTFRIFTRSYAQQPAFVASSSDSTNTTSAIQSKVVYFFLMRRDEAALTIKLNFLKVQTIAD
jgi:hypothetical protein